MTNSIFQSKFVKHIFNELQELFENYPKIDQDVWKSHYHFVAKQMELLAYHQSRVYCNGVDRFREYVQEFASSEKNIDSVTLMISLLSHDIVYTAL